MACEGPLCKAQGQYSANEQEKRGLMPLEIVESFVSSLGRQEHLLQAEPPSSKAPDARSISSQVRPARGSEVALLLKTGKEDVAGAPPMTIEGFAW